MRHIALSFLALALTVFVVTAPAASYAEKALPAKVEAADKASEVVAAPKELAESAEETIDAAPLYTTEKLETLGYAKPWQLGFQPSATEIKHTINDLHYWVTIGMTIIVIFVTILMIYVCVRFRAKANPNPSKVTHNTLVEVVWTVIPILILVAIAIPSLRAHYQVVYNFKDIDMTLKIVGHQWYWSYEYPDVGIAFDSAMKKDNELKDGEPRLLAVDNPVYIPVGAKVRVQVTGADVMHNWAMPAFGIKKDAIPGRLNETWFKVEKEGIYYGQCSELCGKLHGFMPIEVRVVSKEAYASWVKDAKVKFAANRYGTSAVATNQ